MVFRVGRRPYQVAPVAGTDGGLGEVGLEHRGDGGDVGPAGVHDEEVAGGRVVPAGQVGGHDDRLRRVDDHGLLVGVPVLRRGPGDLDGMGAEVGVRGRVHALLPLVQDHVDPHAAPGGGRQVMFGSGVGELVHGHVDAVPGPADEVVDGGEGGTWTASSWRCCANQPAGLLASLNCPRRAK